MATITLDAIGHRYPAAKGEHNDYALKPFTMEWQDGGSYALLGPSGCGKTTLLNIISGLIVPSEGRVLFDDKDVTQLPTHQRNIAQVFQFPVVYDSMTVAQNLEFPLKNRNVPSAQRKQRVADILDILEMSGIANQKARNLSADSKQKISLGRGLVRTDSNAILFDEPLTVIDPNLKWQLRAQLKNVHREVGHTMIYVTHDQTEALTLADTIVVMNHGEILQCGSASDLFETPAHTFVGHFIGSPGMNVLPGTLHGNVAEVFGYSIALASDYGIADDVVEVGIRPEYVRLASADESTMGIPVTVTKVDDIGREKIVQLQLANTRINAILKEHDTIPQSPVAVFERESIHIYKHSKLLQRSAQVATP